MNITSHQIGSNPELEAVRLKTLFSDEGVDDLVIAEFGSTVDVYRSLRLKEIEEHIKSKYCGDVPDMYGLIPTIDTVDIGMVVYGCKEYQDPLSKVTVDGINISGWLLKQYRRNGFSGYLNTVVEVVREHVSDSKHQFYGKQIWTSIHMDNYPSMHASEKSGFSRLGTALDNPDRAIYIVE